MRRPGGVFATGPGRFLFTWLVSVAAATICVCVLSIVLNFGRAGMPWFAFVGMATYLVVVSFLLALILATATFVPLGFVCPRGPRRQLARRRWGLWLGGAWALAFAALVALDGLMSPSVDPVIKGILEYGTAPVTLFGVAIAGRLSVDARIPEEHSVRSCLDCGYDLLGLDPESVCPECGAER